MRFGRITKTHDEYKMPISIFATTIEHLSFVVIFACLSKKQQITLTTRTFRTAKNTIAYNALHKRCQRNRLKNTMKHIFQTMTPLEIEINSG